MNCAKVQTGEKYWVNYTKKMKKKLMFVHTYVANNVIVTLVNPNTLYSFCYTP